ncbi:TetR/AcrR family transcriptional regulator [Burkholderia sp. Bp8963]|uniref:TetR/AcrR family transcriptional regulator n=1 Tax=Burkholderia sp. Bp8963 TaxID=2184547 RepID=UPI00163B25D9|nr:TetR/AcrR family transcriptional regulator [Burkholderia sp. Bp8963]
MADLLQSAEYFFETDGYDGTTMSGIANRAGASVGSLYQFFPSKENIGLALLLRYMDELSGQLDEFEKDLPDTPKEFAHRLISIILDFVAQRPVWAILSDVPALMPHQYALDRLSAVLGGMMASYARSMKERELSRVSITASLMIRAAAQGIRLVDARERASLRREMQRALGSYLEERLSSRPNAHE